MQYKDYYKILGVERTADAETIKKAYRKLARKYHPDVSKETDAEERFKEVNEAYEVLHDRDKRQAYDALGSQWRAGQSFRPPPDWHTRFYTGDGGGFTGSGFSDFFSSLFGGLGGFEDLMGGARHGRRMKSPDRHYRLAIELADSYRGATRRITLPAEAGGRSLEVKIPRGIRPGQVIRLAGQAPAPQGMEPGDVLIEIDFAGDARYHLDGRDVTARLPVAPWEAALGGDAELRLPDGEVKLKIPAGAHSGQKLRLRGRGLPGDPPGDLFAEIEIVMPPADRDAVREAYRELARVSGFKPRG